MPTIRVAQIPGVAIGVEDDETEEQRLERVKYLQEMADLRMKQREEFGKLFAEETGQTIEDHQEHLVSRYGPVKGKAEWLYYLMCFCNNLEWGRGYTAAALDRCRSVKTKNYKNLRAETKLKSELLDGCRRLIREGIGLD